LPQLTQQVPQPVVGGIFPLDHPPGRLSQQAVMLGDPLFHPTQAMVAQVNDVNHKQQGQLPIAQPLPIAMGRGQHPIYNDIYLHFQQPVNQTRLKLD
jgi:hypothetical protein